MTDPASDAIDLQSVRDVARLARLGLSEAELEAARGQLAGLLAHFRSVQDVDTAGIDPLTHALDTPGLAAADEVAPWPDPRTGLLAGAPSAREGFFVVRRVLEDAPEEPGTPGAAA